MLEAMLGLVNNENLEARQILNREFFVGHASQRHANRDLELNFYKF